MKVRAKKHLGQHFLTDEGIALKITEAINPAIDILEVGPGMGVLTKYLVESKQKLLKIIELDWDSIAYLKTNFPKGIDEIIEGDFLKLDLSLLFKNQFAVIGNYPYNISSQILFKVLDYKNQVPEVVGMFQKEVAERIAAPPGNKQYGIISVLLQAYYDIEYLFTVKPGAFNPPPKVQSAVIRLKRNTVIGLDCDEILFKRVVKTAFNQRRKTLRNALSSFQLKNEDSDMLQLRAERLSVAQFVKLTNIIAEKGTF